MKRTLRLLARFTVSRSYPKDVVDRHMLRYSHDKWDFCFDGFFDSFGGLVSRYIDRRCVGFCLFLGLVCLLVSQITSFPGERISSILVPL